MRKLFLSFFILFNYLIYAQFEYPTSTSLYQIEPNGRVWINYNMYLTGCYYVPHETNYQARLYIPGQGWTDWQQAQTGGWWVNKAGTYYIEGRVWATNWCLGTAYEWISHLISSVYA